MNKKETGFLLFLLLQVLNSGVPIRVLKKTILQTTGEAEDLLTGWNPIYFVFFFCFGRVHFGVFRRLPSNIWEQFSHQMMGRQPLVIPLIPTPLLKKAHLHVCAPLTSQLGTTTRDTPLLWGPFCWGSSSSGLEVHRKKSNFPHSLPPSSSCSTGKCIFLTPPCSPWPQRRFWGSTTADVPLFPYHPPSASQPLCEGELERADAFWGD